VDTDFEPDALHDTNSRGLRVMVNDGDVFIGKPYEPKETDA
jgi:hypothetical protein